MLKLSRLENEKLAEYQENLLLRPQRLPSVNRFGILSNYIPKPNVIHIHQPNFRGILFDSVPTHAQSIVILHMYCTIIVRNGCATSFDGISKAENSD